jgi:hypothetical protein
MGRILQYTKSIRFGYSLVSANQIPRKLFSSIASCQSNVIWHVGQYWHSTKDWEVCNGGIRRLPAPVASICHGRNFLVRPASNRFEIRKEGRTAGSLQSCRASRLIDPARSVDE